MEKQDNKKQKTGCGKALIIFIVVYALLCLVYVGIGREARDSIDSFIGALGVMIVIAALIAGFASYK